MRVCLRPLWSHTVDVAGEHGAFLDVGDAAEAGGDALQADGEAAVRGHAVSPPLCPRAAGAHISRPAWHIRAPPTPAPTRYIFPLPTLSIPPDCIKSMVSLLIRCSFLSRSYLFCFSPFYKVLSTFAACWCGKPLVFSPRKEKSKKKEEPIWKNFRRLRLYSNIST